MAYSKLHASIVNSSLWTQRDSVRILFITLLALCDRDGIVYGSKPGLERIAMINPDEADDAWVVLMSPDEDSSDKMRAPENQGRRIEEVPGGFRLLNFEYYRGLRNDDDRREQNRQAQARFKAKSVSVSHSKPDSAKQIHGNPISEAEADTESETKSGSASAPVPRSKFEKPTIEAMRLYAAKLGLPESEASRCFDHYESNGWLVGGKPMRNWQAAMRNWKRNWEERKYENRNRSSSKPNPRLEGVSRNNAVNNYADYAAKRMAAANEKLAAKVAANKNGPPPET